MQSHSGRGEALVMHLDIADHKFLRGWEAHTKASTWKAKTTLVLKWKVNSLHTCLWPHPHKHDMRGNGVFPMRTVFLFLCCYFFSPKDWGFADSSRSSFSSVLLFFLYSTTDRVRYVSARDVNDLQKLKQPKQTKTNRALETRAQNKYENNYTTNQKSNQGGTLSKGTEVQEEYHSSCQPPCLAAKCMNSTDSKYTEATPWSKVPGTPFPTISMISHVVLLRDGSTGPRAHGKERLHPSKPPHR